MLKIQRSFGTAILFLRRAWKRILMLLMKPLFARAGENVHFDPFGQYSFRTIHIGNDVFIGNGANIMASNSKVTIGDKVMFGPNVSLITGDHNTGEIGKYIYDVHEKRPEDDRPIIIQDDIWIGASVIILKGVTIGTGSIVGAGSVVTKSIEPYSIAAGNPAKTIRKRFSDEELIEHKRLLSSDIRS